MHDIKYIRNNPEEFQRKLKRRGVNFSIDNFLELDSKLLELTQNIDSMREIRNAVSKQVGQLKKEGKDVSLVRSQMIELGDKIKSAESDLKTVQDEIRDRLVILPNLPSDITPGGLTEKYNEFVRDWVESPQYDFELRDHLDVAERLGMLDFKRGGRITGSGFPVWSGAGARLERALLNLMLDLHVVEHGYKEMLTPFVATRDSMFGTGQIPKLEADMYHIEKDDLFLLPTSEVTLVNMHAGEIIPEAMLPVKYVAYSPCFRREAGAYGKTTRGFLRTHQFNKVEMVRFEKPDDSYRVLDELVSHAEEVLQKLDLHYRLVRLCAGELPFAAAVCYDLEVWAPADGGRWLEVSSCSNCEDFQARRANIRFRPKDGSKAQFVHTLNGSGLATSRLMVALLETYQTDEGSFAVPPVLRSYLNDMTVITASGEDVF
ncbi:serine--tRNA ligase [bacterium]|nr:serine--tRNA ligase [bacterium]